MLPDVLHHFVVWLSGDEPIDAIVERGVDAAFRTMSCDVASIYVIQEGVLVRRAVQSSRTASANHDVRRVVRVGAGWDARVDRPVLFTADDPRWHPFRANGDDPCHACLIAPLRSRGQLLGLMTLEYRQPHDDDGRDVRLATAIAGLLGARLDIARLAAGHAELAERLDTRIAVDRAKGILQRNLGLTEDEAYRAIQRESRQRRRSKREVAEAIILGDAVGRATTRDASVSS